MWNDGEGVLGMWKLPPAKKLAFYFFWFFGFFAARHIGNLSRVSGLCLAPHVIYLLIGECRLHLVFEYFALPTR